MVSIVILTEITLSKVSSISRNANTQLAGAVNASSIVYNVASLSEHLMVI